MSTRALILGACAILGWAATPAVIAGGVTLTSAGGRQLALTNGQTLPVGAAVRIGTFLLPADTRDETLASTADYVTLKSWFQPLAENGAASGVISQPGGTGAYVRANDFPSAGDVFGTIGNISTGFMPPGTRLYVWVFNHSDPEQATQWGIFTADAWSAPELLGTRLLSTAAAVQALHGSTTPDQLRLRDIPVSYGNWTWKSYSSAAAPATTAPTADPDGDGIANLAEYAWQLRPGEPDANRAQIENLSGAVTFSFKRPRHIPDVSVVAECSPDLKTWLPAGAVLLSSDAVFDTLRATAPTGERCFWRVRFTAIPAP